MDSSSEHRITAIAVVQQLFRFPVKSMRGEELREGRISWHGLDGDRRYAFVKTGNLAPFPWLTARDVPDMLRLAPAFVDPSDPINSSLVVRMLDDAVLPLESPALVTALARSFGAPVHLMRLGRGAFDSLPLSLLSLSTVRDVPAPHDHPVDVRRFRANILVEAFEDRPYVEDGWSGGLLVFGDRPDSARVRVNRPIPRCMMINLDPDTARQDASVLRHVVHTNSNQAAVHASTERPGTIQVGDLVYLVRHEL